MAGRLGTCIDRQALPGCGGHRTELWALVPGGHYIKTLRNSTRRGSLCSFSSRARYFSGASSLCLKLQGGNSGVSDPIHPHSASPVASPNLPGLLCPSPAEPLLQDADAEHGLRAVTQVQVLVLRCQGHLIFLVPLLLLLQLLGLL